MNDFDRRIARLLANEEAQRHSISERRRAISAVTSGIATMTQYRLLCGGAVHKALARWIPTLGVSAARRELGLPGGDPVEPVLSLPGRVLSYRPTEALPPEIADELDDLDEVCQTPGESPTYRVNAAVARLVIGPEHGQRRRAHLWGGVSQARARIEECDYERWWDRQLLRDWAELADYIWAQSTGIGPPDLTSARYKIIMSYEGFESALREMHGSSR